MLQPRDRSEIRWSVRKSLKTDPKNHRKMISMPVCQLHAKTSFVSGSKLIIFEISLISLMIMLPFGLTQFMGESYVIEPTMNSHLGDKGKDLVTVLLVNNEPKHIVHNGDESQSVDYHGRHMNVRPEVGLLTSTARTFIQEGVTTEYATQVLGTTLDNGRYYAQYLKKSSRVLYDQPPESLLAVTATTVSHTPSVFTSWVGETLGGVNLLPQSHNDLYNAAEQLDWRDIDDRILGEQRARNFIGNTDFVRLNDKYTGSTITPVGFASTESSSLFSSNINISNSSYHKSISQNSDKGTEHSNLIISSKYAVNKVQSLENLPTITVRNYFAPSGYSWEAKSDITDFKADHNDSNINVASESDIGLPQDRTPKLYYKQLLGDQGVLSSSLQQHLSMFPLPSRVLFTTTYYGFADFTTIVGDSVIVFSPSSVASQHSGNILGHITSIRGEATLSGSNNAHVSQIPIAIKDDLIEPFMEQPIQTPTKTNLHQVSITQVDDLQSQIGIVSLKQNFSQSTIESNSNINMPTDILIMGIGQLETSEPNTLQIMTSSILNDDSTMNIQTPPMLTRPSDEEIRSIYASLSVAATPVSVIQNFGPTSTQTENIQQQDMKDVTSSSQTLENSSIVSSTSNKIISNIITIDTISNMQIHGGATTIFFEDDPFANFGESTVTAKEAIPVSAITEIDDLITTEGNLITTNINETDDDTTENSSTTIANSIRDEIFDQTTIKSENEENLSNDTTRNSTVPFRFIVEGQDTTDCISLTSQVFLTQVPKTLTQYNTYYHSSLVDAIDISQVTSTSIETVIVPSFDISQATKHYCIQATRVIEGVLVNDQTKSTNMDVQLEKPIIQQKETTSEDSLETTSAYEYVETDTFETPTTELKPKDIISTDITETQTESEIVNEAEEDEKFDKIEEEDDEDEIELIYKTLYTTYTYLTTFFHDGTTSISSHTELLTNVITSTIGISKESNENIEEDDIQASSTKTNEITPTIDSGAFQKVKFIVPSELQSIIRDNEVQADVNGGLLQGAVATPNLNLSDDNLVRKTYYTTYTYYTTIFAEGDTDIMSRTEIFTNFVTDTLSSTDVTPTINQLELTKTYHQNIVEENSTVNSSLVVDNNKYVTMTRQSQTLEVTKPLPPDELEQYSSVTFVTDVRSSSSNGAKQIINNIMLPANVAIPERSLNGRVIDDVGGTVIIDDQISSESNTDEIFPSATLLLQTSFTTFTYYTTMYIGDNTNVASRLETITNVVTETLQPTKTINLEEATLPITYFTTFTYWTKLVKNGEITTLSREETISNVITPTNSINSISIANEENTINRINITGDIKITQDFITNELNSIIDTVTSVEPTNSIDASVYLPIASIDENIKTSAIDVVSYKTLEPTTYFTTYTYYTTSYETDRTITDSRFETITNIVTPTVAQEMHNAVSPDITTEPIATPTLLYDYKRIIDADNISTLYFTTEILAITGVDGLIQESIHSTSSLHIDESKKLLLSSTQNSVSTSVSGDDTNETINSINTATRQYKTGLVRLIDGTRVANRTTTLYQSKVIGTIIDNRYAQIIESTSSFLLDKTALPGVLTSVLDMEDMAITPTNTQKQDFQMTEQSVLNVVVPSSAVVKGSIGEDDHDEENVNFNVDADEEQIEDENLESGKSEGSSGLFGLQNKKRTFTPVIRPFASRNRPQFAPKKKNASASSATIITRSDFTPTITATPALKSNGLGRFSSSRRGGISSSPIFGSGNINTAFGASSSKRYGRPSRSSAGVSSLVSTLTSRRLGGSFIRSSATGGFRSGFSSVYAGGNSRLRLKSTNSLGASIQSYSTDNVSITSTPDNSTVEEPIVQDQSTNVEADENITDSNRRNQNPLLRLRRPLNRPAGFSTVGARPRSGNAPSAVNQVSVRRNPLNARAKTTPTPNTTIATTTTRPKSNNFHRPTITSFQNRSRPQSNLFPPRSLFQAQRPIQSSQQNDIGEDRKSENADSASDSDDDAEYDDDEEEGDEEDNDDGDVNRRRRSNRKINNQKTLNKPLIRLTGGRIKRDTTNANYNARTNFRSRFRQPKPITPATAEQRNTNSKETTTVETSSPTTPRTRIGSRFSSRYQHTISTLSSTLATTESKTTSNYRGIRPTRPINGRAQFTLREKDSAGVQKALTRPGTSGTSSFRRPQTGASSRRPSSSANNGSKPSSGSRRLKSYNSNSNIGSNSDSNGRNSGTARSRNGGTSSVRNRNNNNNRGRSRNEYNTDQFQPVFDGTITVTHIIPAEVTIPVVNGKVTEYRNIVTGKTSTEIVSPQQWTSFLGTNGQTTLALTRQDSSVNFAGATEITQYILHESSTTTITFTPTTIRGRKTSFSHILPSTAYSVEQIVSTAQPQISANAPLANILLSQLLLGNIGLPGANPLLVTQAPGFAGLNQPAAQTQVTPAKPITEFRTHASTYVTTLFEGMSTILPVTFQGKKILTTVYDTTAQTITATEFITDTIVTTPTVQFQQQPPAAAQVNSILLQQLLLQQQLQPQQQLLTDAPELILQSTAPQLLYSDQLQELDTNNIRLSQEHDNIDDLTTFALTPSPKSNGNRKKPGRKSGKSHKRNKQHQQHDTTMDLQESSIITLYVSGRRPGEFSTILSTVYNEPSTLRKRQATAVFTTVLPDVDSTEAFYSDYYASDGSEILPIVAKVNEENQNRHWTNAAVKLDSESTFQPVAESSAAINNLLNDNDYKNELKLLKNAQNDVSYMDFTQSLESIVGDVGLWYTKSTQTYNKDNLIASPSTDVLTDLKVKINMCSSELLHELSPSIVDIDSNRIHKRGIITEIFENVPIRDITTFYNDKNTYVNLDEARYNLATRIMSNGVEVIIASDKGKLNSTLSPKSSFVRIMSNGVSFKPHTLAPSTLKNQMILVIPSNIQENFTVQINTHQLFTKTCLTTYTYRTTYLENGQTSIESREKVVANVSTDENNYLQMSPVLSLGVILTRTPELAVGIFATTYSYFNTIFDDELPLVMTSEQTVTNTVTGPDPYILFLQPSETATPALDTNTYYTCVTLTRTVNDSNAHQVLITTNALTQVIVTESQPIQSTLAQLSYFPNDTNETLHQEFDIKPTSTIHNDQSLQSIQTLDDLYDMHIYATKTFLTTFTYYTTSSLSNSELKINPDLTESNIPTFATTPQLKTVVKFHTRIIENVITKSVPSSILWPEFISEIRSELQKTGKHQRRIIVTTITLKSGNTLKVTAVNMFKPDSLISSNINNTFSVQNNNNKTINKEIEIANPIFEKQQTTLTGAIDKFILKTNKLNNSSDTELASSELDEVYVSPSPPLNDFHKNTSVTLKYIGNIFKSGSTISHPLNITVQTFSALKTHSSTIHEPQTQDQKQNINLSNTNDNEHDIKPASQQSQQPQQSVSLNHLFGSFDLNRLYALGPVFNAMAGLLQSNFYEEQSNIMTPYTTSTALYVTESKNIPKNITVINAAKNNNNTSTKEIQHIYIPVQSGLGLLPNDLLDGTGSTTNLSGIDGFSPPKTLHIQPPQAELTINDDNWLKKTSPNSNYYISLPKQRPLDDTIATTNVHQMSLLNSGIPIRPGEVITANSDIIIGKPNGIKVPHFPKEYQRQQPIDTEASGSQLRIGMIPAVLNNGNYAFESSPPPPYSLFNAKSTDVTYYKHLIQHPPPPPPPLKKKLEAQSHIIPLHEEPEYKSHPATIHTNFDRKRQWQLQPPPLPTVPDTMKHNIFNGFYKQSSPFAPALISAVPFKSQQHQHRENLPNVNKLNSEIQHNEILEIKRIPEVYSTDLPSISEKGVQYQQQYYQPHSNQQHISLDTHELSHNVDLNVPPLTFNKEVDYPHVSAVHGQISNTVKGDGHKAKNADAMFLFMSHVKIPSHKANVQVKLTPQNIFNNIDYTPVLKLTEPSLSHNSNTYNQQQHLQPFHQILPAPTLLPPLILRSAVTQKPMLQLNTDTTYTYRHKDQQQLAQGSQHNNFHHILPTLPTQTTTNENEQFPTSGLSNSNNNLPPIKINQLLTDGDMNADHKYPDRSTNETNSQSKFSNNRWHELVTENVKTDVVALLKKDQIDSNYVSSYSNNNNTSLHIHRFDHKTQQQEAANNLSNLKPNTNLNVHTNTINIPKNSNNLYSSSNVPNAKKSESSAINWYTQPQIKFTPQLPMSSHMTIDTTTIQKPIQLKSPIERQPTQKFNNNTIVKEGSQFHTTSNDENFNNKNRLLQTNAYNKKQQLQHIHVLNESNDRFSLPPKKLEQSEYNIPAAVHSTPTRLVQTTTIADMINRNKINLLENDDSLNRSNRPQLQLEQQPANEIFISFETSHPLNFGVINETLIPKQINKAPTKMSMLPHETKPLLRSSYKEKAQEQKIETPALNIQPPPLSADLNIPSTESVLGLNPPPPPQSLYTSGIKTLYRDIISTPATLASKKPHKNINTSGKWYSPLPLEHKINNIFSLPSPLPSSQIKQPFVATVVTSPIQKQTINTTSLSKHHQQHQQQHQQQQQFIHSTYANPLKRTHSTTTMLPVPSQSTANAMNTTRPNIMRVNDSNRSASIITVPTVLIPNRISTTLNIFKATITANASNISQHKEDTLKLEEQREQQTHLQHHVIVKPTKSINTYNHSIPDNTIHKQHQHHVNISTSGNYANINFNENSSQWTQHDNTIEVEPSLLYINVITFDSSLKQPAITMTQSSAIMPTLQLYDNKNILYQNAHQEYQNKLHKSNTAMHQIVLPTTKYVVTTIKNTVSTTSQYDIDDSTRSFTSTPKTLLLTKTQASTIANNITQTHSQLQHANATAPEIIQATQTIAKTSTLISSSVGMPSIHSTSDNSSTFIKNNQNHNLKAVQSNIKTALYKYDIHGKNHIHNNSNTNSNITGNNQSTHATIEVVLSNVLIDKREKHNHQQQQQQQQTTENNNILIVMSDNNNNHNINKNKYTNNELLNIPNHLEEPNIITFLDDKVDDSLIPYTGSESESESEAIDYVQINSSTKKDDPDLPERSEDFYPQLNAIDNVNRVLLGGVLLETHPKLRDPQQQADNNFEQCQPMCKNSRNELCALVESRQRCICRPGFARMFPDRPCKPTYSYALSILTYSIGHYTLHYDPQLADNTTADFRHLAGITHNAVDRMIMQSDFRDLYHGVYLTSFESLNDVSVTNSSKNNTYILANLLLQLSDNSDEKRLESVFKKYLRLSNYSIGSTVLHTNKKGVDWLSVVDFDECANSAFHDCSSNAQCFNLRGTYTCSCKEGFADFSENAIYPGRVCSAELIGCDICNYHGKCVNIQSISKADPTVLSHNKHTENLTDHVVCECFSWYSGVRCRINLKMLLIVLIVASTLLSILFIFCMLLICPQRRKRNSQLSNAIGLDVNSLDFGIGVSMATSTSSQSALPIISAANITKNLQLESGQTKMQATSLKKTKNTKILKNNSINIDKKKIIKDSSSEASQNSMDFVLKKDDQKEPLTLKSRKCSLKTVADFSAIPSFMNTNSSIRHSLLPTNTFTQSLQKIEQHFPEQTDRSLTIMIPRAKYHHSVPSQTQLLRHHITMERTDNKDKKNSDTNWTKLYDNIPKPISQQHYAKKHSISSNGHQQQSLSLLSTASNGALVSAGFEVCAIVNEDVLSSSTNSAQLMETANCSTVPLLTKIYNIANNETNVNTSLLPDITDTSNKDVDANIIINNDISEFTKQQQDQNEYNVYHCDKTLKDTMDVWLDNVQQNKLSAEARSFDETTVQAATKSLRICFNNQSTYSQDKANTMAERDIGSPVLIPHTHLYKSERQESEMSGFDSF